MILADLGAKVIKAEIPDGCDSRLVIVSVTGFGFGFGLDRPLEKRRPMT